MRSEKDGIGLLAKLELITKIGRICHVKSGADANGLIFKAA